MAASENTRRVRRLEVVLENSHKCVYYPNQFVEGHVLLEVAEHMASRGLYINFCGCGNVFWREERTGQFHRCVDTVTFESTEEYFRIQERLQEESLLAPGVYKLPFKFQLTSKLPENYKDNICEIEYFLDARLKVDHDRRNDYHTKKPFTILNPLDLNTLIIPDVTLPIQRQQSETVCYALCRSAPIWGHFWVERGGYTPGETMILGAHIDNGTHRAIKSSYVRLIQETLYHTAEKTQEYTEELGRVTKGAIPAGGTYEWKDVPLTFPADHTVFNVGPSNILTTRYVLELVVEPRWTKRSIVLPLQLTVGTIRLKHKTKAAPPHERLTATTQAKSLAPLADYLADTQRNGKQTNTPRSRDGRPTNTPHSRDGGKTEILRQIDDTNTPQSRTDRDLNIQRSTDDGQTDAQQGGKQIRQRKKARHRRVTPTDVTDTRGYITEILEKREAEKSFTKSREGTPIN